MYQETNNPAIGGLAQTLIQQNSRDLFSLPAFTHHLQTTMKLPQKQKKIECIYEQPLSSPEVMKSHNILLPIKRCKMPREFCYRGFYMQVKLRSLHFFYG